MLLPPAFSICKINCQAFIYALERLELFSNAYPFRQNTKFVVTVIKCNPFVMGQLSVAFLTPMKLCVVLSKITIFHMRKFFCECVDQVYMHIRVAYLKRLGKTMFVLMH